MGSGIVEPLLSRLQGLNTSTNGLAFTPVDPLNNTSNTSSNSTTIMKETKDSSNESTEFSHDENKIEEFDRHSVDVENRLAFKGDDSDGNVAWNFRAAFAAACLCGLYTGMTLASQSARCFLILHEALKFHCILWEAH